MSYKVVSLLDKVIDFINKSNEEEQKSEEQPKSPQHNEVIINQLIEFQIGSRSQIIKAMEMVNDKNNIEEIAEYLMTMTTDNQHTENTNNNDKVTLLMSMGYDINSVKKALEIANNDTQIAAQYLIDGLININQYNQPIKYTQPIQKVSKQILKPIEFQNVNNKTKIYSGALMQIVTSNHKGSISQFWNESNISSLYDENLRGLVGIIKCIQPNNQTIKIETSEQKEYVVPIKACLSIKYDRLTDKEDMLLICGYLRGMNVHNVPPLINKFCYDYYHIVRLRLNCDDSKENDLLITRDACKLSKYLNSIMVLCDNKISKIYIKDIPYETLKMAVEWLSYHNGIEPKPLPMPITSNVMKEICDDVWDADYIDCKNKKTIFELILASNRLKIKGLLHLGSAKIASLIKQMDQTEINRIIDEEERYRRANANNT